MKKKRFIDVNEINFKGIEAFPEKSEILVPLSDVRKALQMTPTADVVEVVRCKDCFKRDTEECWCAHSEDDYKTGFDENGFCSGGERKERK